MNGAIDWTIANHLVDIMSFYKCLLFFGICYWWTPGILHIDAKKQSLKIKLLYM